MNKPEVIIVIAILLVGSFIGYNVYTNRNYEIGNSVILKQQLSDLAQTVEGDYFTLCDLELNRCYQMVKLDG